MQNLFKKKKVIIKIFLIMVLSFILSLALSLFWCDDLWKLKNIFAFFENLDNNISFNRVLVLFYMLFYIGLHLVLPIKKMYKWLFRKRWLIGVCILLFLTLNRYHGDSIGYYYNVIQPGEGTELSLPILGETRSIRSDEFIVNTPSILASSYGDSAFAKYNSILRGTETLNIITGVYLGLATIACAPWELVYAVLPLEYAFSFCWYAPIILSFLMSIEIFYIISKKNKKVAMLGAILVICSSFYLWWGFPTYFISGPGTIVCLYYFLNNKNKYLKYIFGIGIAICFSNFVVNLYPAWQVPFGYMFLIIGIWTIWENLEKIKKLNKMEWIILICSIFIALSLIFSYLYMIRDYVEIINATVYPGKRSDTGTFALPKLFYYTQAPFYAYKDIGNASEVGVFFNLFPLPTILAFYYWLVQRKKNWLTGGLLLIQIPMLIYISIGLPEIIAKITLLSYSTGTRTADVIGIIQVYFIIIILSHYKDEKKIPFKIAIPTGILIAGVAIFMTKQKYPDYLDNCLCVIMIVIVTYASVVLITRYNKKMMNSFVILMVGISIITAIYIRPLMKGLDAIYSKPVVEKITEIQEQEDAIWLTCGLEPVLSSFNVACGAPTINSVNIYPNMTLWRKLDDKNLYNKIYNRYAHITIRLTNEKTNFELIQDDWIQINLSYEDIKITGATYLLSTTDMCYNFDNKYVKFEKKYEENGLVIYKMNYKK